ncbi:hypothetical protein G9A89_000079 [Geosiphon pyriformis]|nr:hypothetical protein G9A89_000079 [Geosiphon pyriformis]
MSHKKISPTKLPVARGNQNHPIFHSNAKTAGKNCPPWELGLCLIKTIGCRPITIANHTTVNATATQNAKTSETTNHVLLVANNCLTKGCGTTFLVEEKPATHRVNTQFLLMTNYSHDENKIWKMANAKIEGTLHSEILEIKNNSSEPVEVYCNECDLIYNLTPYKIYTIPKEEEPISSYTSELDSIFNPNSNPNNDDNNSFSSVQNNNSNNNGNLNSDSDSKQYITLSNLSKEQKLRWFSDNNKGIMPERTHDTNAGFDLRYLGKDAIKLEPHLHCYL